MHRWQVRIVASTSLHTLDKNQSLTTVNDTICHMVYTLTDIRDYYRDYYTECKFPNTDSTYDIKINDTTT